MTILTILRGNYVRRFHSNPDLAIFGDTVGHHHAMVAQIVLHLWPAASRDILRHAILHDSAEQFVGDMPQPFKAESPDVAAAHREIEDDFLAGVIGLQDDLSEREAAILKLADGLAAYLHIRHVAPYVLAGNGWPEGRERFRAAAWELGADIGAKVEGIL